MTVAITETKWSEGKRFVEVTIYLQERSTPRVVTYAWPEIDRVGDEFEHVRVAIEALREHASGGLYAAERMGKNRHVCVRLSDSIETLNDSPLLFSVE